jgi:hypothetical protein
MEGLSHHRFIYHQIPEQINWVCSPMPLYTAEWDRTLNICGSGPMCIFWVPQVLHGTEAYVWAVSHSRRDAAICQRTPHSPTGVKLRSNNDTD